jgi:hypothetical protein
MVMSPQRAFVQAIGQRGTVVLGFGLSFAFGMALLVVVTRVVEHPAVIGWVPGLIAGTVVPTLWVCWAVRCPSCGARIVWIAIYEQGMNNWMRWLLSLVECPKCRHRPSIPRY